MKPPKTLQDAIVYFSDADRAFEYAKNLRWPDGKVICPRCESEQNYFIKTRKIWLCRGCNKQFTIKVGTIFEDSALGMDKWMAAFWMLCNCKNGVSSMEIHRTIGVTQKSAWFMLQRLRLAMQDGFYTTKLGSKGHEVEVDETFIGGKARNMHKNRKAKLTGRIDDDKAVVVGFMERGGRVRTEIVTQRRKHNMQPLVREHVQAGAALYTDALKSYIGLDKHYEHEVIDHAVEYVRGKVHTNMIENFWSLVKRALHGTYVSVEPFHLYRYLDEQMFRFNNRKKMNDSQRFALAMSQVGGKRLTYADLTGKNESPRHETTGTGEIAYPPMPF
ncbi:MAG TPA: IS1595 family transposase [Terriglobales bacterium]|jgi:transposase-like protein|nr:IS1595 family transposase [Terriglobales bacterium]